jgi:hypothetical protein
MMKFEHEEGLPGGPNEVKVSGFFDNQMFNLNTGYSKKGDNLSFSSGANFNANLNDKRFNTDINAMLKANLLKGLTGSVGGNLNVNERGESIFSPNLDLKYHSNNLDAKVGYSGDKKIKAGLSGHKDFKNGLSIQGSLDSGYDLDKNKFIAPQVNAGLTYNFQAGGNAMYLNDDEIANYKAGGYTVIEEFEEGGEPHPPLFKEFLGEEPGTFTTENFQDKDGYNLELLYPRTNMKRRPTRFGYDDYDKGYTEITKGDENYRGIKKELKPIVKQEFKEQKLNKRFPREEYYKGNKTYKPSQEFLDQVAYQAAHKDEDKMGDTDVLVNMIYDDLNLQGFDIGTNTGTRKQRKLAQRLGHSPAWYAANALKEKDALGVSMPKYAPGGAYVLEELKEGGDNGKKSNKDAYIKNVMGFLDTDGVNPLDLVYGNKELGIPKMGTLEGLSSIPELQDYFFDPYGDMMDTYIEQRGDPKEQEAATKRKRENYLNNVERTEEEDQAYEEKIRVEEAIAADKAYKEECKDPASDCFKRAAQRRYQASRDYDDSGQFIKDVGSLIGDNYAEMTYKPVVRTAKKAYNDPIGLVSDLGTTAGDLIASPFTAGKELYDYTLGDGNFEFNKVFDTEALGTSLDALSVIPVAKGLNSSIKAAKPLLNKVDNLLMNAPRAQMTLNSGVNPSMMVNAYQDTRAAIDKIKGIKFPFSKTGQQLDQIKGSGAYWDEVGIPGKDLVNKSEMVVM